jgi:hypothetical protein
MTKKTKLYENKDFEIIKIDSLTAVCCGNVPFKSFCIKVKGSLQQFNLDEDKFKSLQELLRGEITAEQPLQ